MVAVSSIVGTGTGHRAPAKFDFQFLIENLEGSKTACGFFSIKHL
jgi:hypothetical protein